ncbi:MAG: galactosamine-6-phosphate isomerase [Bacteroidia bacterium]|jgi:galactosamine-6-phosphate isomerase
MNIKILKDSDEIAKIVSDLVIEDINQNPTLLLCTATGGTPTKIYNSLIIKKNIYPTDQIRILKLDEWGGVPMDNPETCEHYMQKHIIRPLNISPDNYFGFNSDPTNPKNEIQRVKNLLIEQGPIDVCILGLGLNGHIAFNEPPSSADVACHVAMLSAQSLAHPMALKMGITPTYGLTLGIKEILQSKKIYMLINGSHKMQIAKKFLSGEVTNDLPASHLWAHPNVHCFIDKSANSNS